MERPAFRTVASVAEWHRKLAGQYDESAGIADFGARCGCEDAFYIARGYRELAAQHREMAITLEQST